MLALSIELKSRLLAPDEPSALLQVDESNLNQRRASSPAMTQDCHHAAAVCTMARAFDRVMAPQSAGLMLSLAVRRSTPSTPEIAPSALLRSPELCAVFCRVQEAQPESAGLDHGDCQNPQLGSSRACVV